MATLCHITERAQHHFHILSVQVEMDVEARDTAARRHGSGKLKRLLRSLKSAIEAELTKRKQEGTLRTKWGCELSDHERWLKSMERSLVPARSDPNVDRMVHAVATASSSINPVSTAAIAAGLARVSLREASNAAAENAQELVSGETAEENRRKRNAEHLRLVTQTLRARSARRLPPLSVPVEVIDPIRGVDYRSKSTFKYLERTSQRIARNEGLNLKRKPTTLEYFQMRHTQARIEGNQGEITQYGNAIAKVKANNTRKNQRRRANRKANREYRRAYIANLAGNMSDVDDDEERDDVESLADPAEL